MILSLLTEGACVTSMETCKPLHRKMPLNWKWHSSVQSTSNENVASLEMAFVYVTKVVFLWKEYNLSVFNHVNNWYGYQIHDW